MGADRHMQGRTAVENGHAASQARRAMQRDGPHVTLVQVLVNFEPHLVALKRQPQGLAERGQTLAANNDHWALNLVDVANWRVYSRLWYQ